MLAIRPTSSQKCTPNLLPMRINHNGRIENTEQYWTPTTDEKGTQHTHFRGRHLHGTPLPLPAHYTGAVLNITDKSLPLTSSNNHSSAHNPQDDDEEDQDMEAEDVEEVLIAEQIGSFDELVVWGHGGTVGEEGDAFVRGVREWVGFAEGMHWEGDEEGLNGQKRETEGEGGKA